MDITSKDIRVRSLDHLKRLAKKEDGDDFYIRLNGGFRSSKHIHYDGEKFWVINEIDDTEETFTEAEIMDESKTNIGVAIDKSALYKMVY